MYVIVHHRFTYPLTAFDRGVKLIKNEDVPAGTRGLQFYPNRSGSEAICLWESESVADVQGYVDETLRDASVNVCWEACRRRPPAARWPPFSANATGQVNTMPRGVG